MATSPRDVVPPRLRVLTVGDGDLSYSLALARCFGPTLRLTATTLCTEAELARTYAHGARNALELAERGAVVRWCVDATALDAEALGEQDVIVFNHPHLGLADLADVAAHARRHSVLLGHFFSCAAALLAPSGRVHMALCGSQPANWHAHAHAARHGLALRSATPTAVTPDLAQLFGAPPIPAQSGWGARRRFRVGSTLGTKHYLAAWGYEHRRTESDADMRVDGGVELIYVREAAGAPAGVEAGAAAGVEICAEADGAPNAEWRCAVCGHVFDDAATLAAHVSTLALPDVALQAAEDDTPPADADTAADDDAGADAASLTCAHCGAAHTSRNALFRHLAGCGPTLDLTAAPSAKKARAALLITYVGAGYFGSALGSAADETVRPTIEGAVLRAARSAWGDGLSIGAVCRTERAASAVVNCVVLSGRAAACARATDAAERLRTALPPRVRLLAPPLPITSGSALDDLRRAARLVAFRVGIPYRHLRCESRAADAGGGGGSVGGGDDDGWLGGTCGGDGERTVYVSRLPDNFDADALTAVLARSGHSAVEVRAPRCGGFLEAVFDSEAGAADAASALDGAHVDGEGAFADGLFALPLREAREKIDIHKRLKIALRALCGGDGAARSREWANFAGAKRLARNPTLVRSMLRCSSGLHEDVRPKKFAEEIAEDLADAVECTADDGGAAVRDGRWEATDWAVVTLSAREFAQEQVRRMAGVLVAAVRAGIGADDGAISREVERYFAADAPPTPLAPAQAIWLERFELAPRRGGGPEPVAELFGRVTPESARRARREVEAAMCREAAAPYDAMVRNLPPPMARSDDGPRGNPALQQ